MPHTPARLRPSDAARATRSRHLLALAAVLLVTACGEAATPAAKPPPREQLVELAEVTAGSLEYPAERSGNLRALREARISNEETGRITRLSVRAGDRVAAGSVLVQYDDALLRAALDKARATAEVARSEHQRAGQLVGRGFVSGEAETRARGNLEIAEAEQRQLETRLGYLTLRAPFAGVIAERRAEPGDVTPAHTHLLTLLDPAQLVTEVSVPEALLATLAVGDPAGVRIDALGEAPHRGRIVRIHPAIDPTTRMGRVEIILDSPPPSARPGQFCRVVLRAPGAARPIAPLAAIQRDAREEYVFVYRAAAGQPGSVERRPVTTGQRLADRVEVISGLSAGDTVVIRGFLGLAPGKPVKVVGDPAAPAAKP